MRGLTAKASISDACARIRQLWKRSFIPQSFTTSHGFIYSFSGPFLALIQTHVSRSLPDEL